MSGACTVVCRTCLSFSTRMHDLRDTRLRETYENITKKKLNTGLGGTLLCYLCYAQLKKCSLFTDMSWKSEVILTELVSKGVDITQETIARLGLTSSTASYSVTPVDYYYNGFREAPEAVVKEDTHYECQVVKEENIEIEEEGQRLVKVKEEQVIKEEPVFLEEVTVIKEEFEEMWMEEEIDIEGEVTLYENCEPIAKTGEMPYEEEYVDIEYVNKNLPILNVTNITRQELKFKCDVCSKEFNSKSNLKQHKKIHARKVYTCDYCARSFNYKYSIEKHIKTHGQKKPYTCQLCDKTFRRQSYLKDHVKIHAKERPYICHSCGKAFTDKSSLNRHVTTHLGIKTIVCGICNKRFYRNEHLVIHMSIHTKLRPYTCKVCNHSFSQKCSLTGHMRIHTGEKRHYCSLCNKSFQRRSHVQQHMVVHDRDKLA